MAEQLPWNSASVEDTPHFWCKLLSLLFLPIDEDEPSEKQHAEYRDAADQRPEDGEYRTAEESSENHR